MISRGLGLRDPSVLRVPEVGVGDRLAQRLLLGRYWSRGPQRTLHVPGPVTRESVNELIILELQAAATATVSFVARAGGGDGAIAPRGCPRA